MAFSTPSTGNSGGGFTSRSVPTTVAEINVTPLVDVMLVLLIVFMISAPLMQQGIQVDLPKANAGTLNEIPDQVVLVINSAKEISLNGKSIQAGTLRDRLAAIVDAKPNVEIFIQADQSIAYGYIAQVMAEAKRAHINRVGLVTAPGDPSLKL
jgi:biopolymer transport protein TolR